MSEVFVSIQRDRYVKQVNTTQPSILVGHGFNVLKRFLESRTQLENIVGIGKLLVGQQYPQQDLL